MWEGAAGITTYDFINSQLEKIWIEQAQKPPMQLSMVYSSPLGEWGGREAGEWQCYIELILSVSKLTGRKWANNTHQQRVKPWTAGIFAVKSAKVASKWMCWKKAAENGALGMGIWWAEWNELNNSSNKLHTYVPKKIIGFCHLFLDTAGWVGKEIRVNAIWKKTMKLQM